MRYLILLVALLVLVGTEPALGRDKPSATVLHGGLGAELAARTGGTVAYEIGRLGAHRVTPLLTRCLTPFMAAGAAGLVAEAVLTAGIYMAYKTGWELVASSISGEKRKKRLDPIQIVAVGVGAAAGSMLLGRFLHPLIGAWLGEWFGWVFAENLVDRWRKTGRVNPIAAAGEIDVTRTGAMALATEATSHSILHCFGLSAGIAGAKGGLGLIMAGFATKILGSGLAKLKTAEWHDKRRSETVAKKAALPALAPVSSRTTSAAAYRQFLSSQRGNRHDPAAAAAAYELYRRQAVRTQGPQILD